MTTGFRAIRTLDKVPVSELKGVGAVLAGKLQRIGICSIQDLLLHLPTRYMDRTRITPIGGLQPNAHYVIEGSVRASDIVIGKRRSLVVRLQDDTLSLIHI